MAFITGGDDAEKVSKILKTLANSLSLFDKGVLKIKESMDKKVDAFSAPIKRAQEVKAAVDKVKKSMSDYKKETDAIKGKFMAMGRSVPTKVLDEMKNKMTQSIKELTALGGSNISLQHEMNTLAASTSHLGNNFNKALDGLDRLNAQQDNTIKKGVGITGNFYQTMSNAIGKIPLIGQSLSGAADITMEAFEQISKLVGEMNAFDMPSFSGISGDVEMFASKLSIAPQDMIKAYAMNRDLLVKLSPEMDTMNDVFRNTNKIITQDVDSINGSLRDFANDMSRTPAEAFQNVITVSNIMKNAGLDLRDNFHDNAGELINDMKKLSKLNGMEYNAMTKLYEQHINSSEIQEYMLTIDEKDRKSKLKEISTYAEMARVNGILTEDFLALQRNLMANQREQSSMDRFVEAQKSEAILSMYIGAEKAAKISQLLTASQEDQQEMLATDKVLQEALTETATLQKKFRDGVGYMADDTIFRMVTGQLTQFTTLLTKASVSALGLTEQQAEMIKKDRELQGFEDEAIAAKKAYDEFVAGFFQDPAWALKLGTYVGEGIEKLGGLLYDLYDTIRGGFDWLMGLSFFEQSVEEKQALASRKGMVYDVREKEEIGLEEAKKRLKEMETSGTYAGRGISPGDMEFYGKKLRDSVAEAEKVEKIKQAKKDELFVKPEFVTKLDKLTKDNSSAIKKLSEGMKEKGIDTTGLPTTPPISGATSPKAAITPPITKIEEESKAVTSPDNPIAQATNAVNNGLGEVNKKLGDNNTYAAKQYDVLDKLSRSTEEHYKWIKENTPSKFNRRQVSEATA